MGLLTTGYVLAGVGDGDHGDVVVVTLHVVRYLNSNRTLRNYWVLEMMCLTTMVVPSG